MDNLFLIILLLSLVALVVGVFSPKLTMPWSSAPTRQKALGLYVALAIVSFIGFGVSTDIESSKNPEVASISNAHLATEGRGLSAGVAENLRASPAKTPTAVELVAQKMPDSQREFLKVVDKAASVYEDAPNELVKSKTAKQRDDDLRVLTPGKKLEDWVGIIEKLQTNREGMAIVSIRANSMVKFKTWNNAISDIEGNTLIPQESPLFDALSSFSEGMPVRFSGHLVSEGSLTERGSMRNPEFIVRFNRIEQLK